MNAPAVAGLRPLTFTALVGTMAIMTFVAVVGPIVRRLGLAEWHAGLAIAVAGLLWMLMARRWGATSDRRGRKPVLLVGLAASALFYLLLAVYVDAALRQPPAIVLSVLALVLLRGLIGAFYAAVPPTAAAWVADRVPPAARASAMARLGSANAAGLVIGPAAAGWLAGYGLQWPLYAAALLPLLALLVLWKTLDNGSAAPPPRPPGKVVLLWSDARLRLPMAAALAAVSGVAVAQVTIGFFALDRLALAPLDAARVAGRALTAVGCALLLSQLLVMQFRQVSPARWIALGAMLSAFGFASMLLVHGQIGLFAAYALIAFGMGMVMPAFQAATANAVQAHEQGAAAGTVAAMQGLGMVLGPLLGTGLYRLSPVAPYLLAAAVMAALALLVASRAMARSA